MRNQVSTLTEKAKNCLKNISLGARIKLRTKVTCDQGQASTEYVIATFIGLAAVVALAGLYGYFALAGSERGSHSDKTYLRAPYTLPSQGSGSEQWAKDLIIH
ncbi:MAG: hypothetical protein FWE48_00425 [Coriobacteriia bacterium]|nr:hypothetical protein [Coriobacteriia bacterium]MCL2745552.1 hypothetical protein [Coriobacteriia bacterium]MCL2870432.1 hypothetical protein [Coriobacteriia bacterium]